MPLPAMLKPLAPSTGTRPLPARSVLPKSAFWKPMAPRKYRKSETFSTASRANTPMRSPPRKSSAMAPVEPSARPPAPKLRTKSMLRPCASARLICSCRSLALSSKSLGSKPYSATRARLALAAVYDWPPALAMRMPKSALLTPKPYRLLACWSGVLLVSKPPSA